MRPETIEELKRLAECNDNVIVEYDNFGVLTVDMQPYYYAYEMPSKIGLYFKQCAPSNILYLIEKLHRFEWFKANTQLAATTKPSEALNEFVRSQESVPPKFDEVFKKNMRKLLATDDTPKLDEKELLNVAGDLCKEIYGDYESTFMVGFTKGYRYAMGKK
jgi:hypothetical protein